MKYSKRQNAYQNALISRKTARDRWQAFRDNFNFPAETISLQPEPTLGTYPKVTRSDLVVAVDGLTRTRGGWYTDLQAILANGDEEDEQTSVSLTDLLTSRWCIKDFIYTAAHEFAPPSVIFPHELTNELHPLLTRPHWQNTTDWTWKQLQPVLTLVSKFLTTQTTWDWFTHVATGEVKSQPGTTHRYVGPSRKPLTQAEKYQAVQAIFAKMEKTVRFFIDETKGKFGKGSIAAIHLGTKDMHEPAQSVIILEKELLLAMVKLRVQPARAEDCNIQTFRIAVTLLHEISHAFNWAAHRFATKLDDTTQEPAFHCRGPLNVVRECGMVYEQLTFGYPLSFKWLTVPATPDAQPPNLVVFRISESALRMMYPETVGNAPDSPKNDTSVLFPPSSWVQKWFLRSTWQRIEREGLGFMTDEARSLKLGYKPNYPIANWGTAYVVVPGNKNIRTMCFPLAKPLASGPDYSVHLQIPIEQMQEEVDFASAWSETFGQLNVAALVMGMRKRIKVQHGKRKDVDPVWGPGYDLLPCKKRKLVHLNLPTQSPIEDLIDGLRNLMIRDPALK